MNRGMSGISAPSAGRQCKTGQIHATEEDNSSFFGIPNTKFYSVICARCGYTELYEAGTSEVWNFRNLPESD